MAGLAEYIWIDGSKPTQQLRSKARFFHHSKTHPLNITDFPIWSFDGSSTYQSPGGHSDLLLQPVLHAPDPLRGEGSYLVLCEVLNADGTPHASNTRARLRHVLDQGGQAQDPWVGFEQEYTLYQDGRPLGWPAEGSPKPQGPYYCGVGSDKAYGRPLVEHHAQACLDAELLFYGLNGEVMPGQWEFQIGYRGNPQESTGALKVCDHHWLARWLLHRLAEEFGITVSFDNKPMAGDWNGAGCHTNFSTNRTRDPKTGLHAIEEAVALLSQHHAAHIRVYGHGLEHRLTGHHETCSIHEFRSGVADRGSSIRIPQQVQLEGYGYLEDRRPGANCDPYLVATQLVATICAVPELCSEGV